MFALESRVEYAQAELPKKLQHRNNKPGLWLVKWLPLLLFLVLLLLWASASQWLHHIDGTAAGVDQTIWLLIILSLIAFLLIVAICWWLTERFWMMAGLPGLSMMVSQFYTLSLWQQLGFYWASFVSLLLVASLCIGGIC